MEIGLTKVASLPDDIEQRILDGQWSCAVHALVIHRGITLEEARSAIGDWLRERAAEGDHSQDRST
jgi:hypothetical protein